MRRAAIPPVLAGVLLGSATAAAAQAPALQSPLHWQQRLSVSVGAGLFSPTANGQLYALLGNALTPGRRMLRPRMASVTAYYATTPNVALVWRTDVGGQTATSVSMAQPTTPTSDLSQRTSLRIRLQSTLGFQFTPWRWTTPADDRMRVRLGAGMGAIAYSLSQRGTFVDATRLVAYAADYRSSGVGPFTYASGTLEVPLRPGLAVSTVVRQQWGSARMSQDYAAFDRLDFGGTSASIGMTLSPSGRRRW